MLDANVDELAGRRRADEVDCRVPAGPSAQERCIRAAEAFDEDFLHPTHAFCVAARGDVLDDVDESLDAVALALVRELIVHRGRFGPGTRRVHERERTVETDLLHDFERLAEVDLRLSGKA